MGDRVYSWDELQVTVLEKTGTLEMSGKTWDGPLRPAGVTVPYPEGQVELAHRVARALASGPRRPSPLFKEVEVRAPGKWKAGRWTETGDA